MESTIKITETEIGYSRKFHKGLPSLFCVSSKDLPSLKISDNYLVRDMKNIICVIFLFGFIVLDWPHSTQAANPDDILINEIAWMGSKTSHTDEWIELYNNADSPINLDSWVLKAADGSPEIKLTGNIPANGFYLLERSKDYTGALNNKGEKLELYDDLGNLIDSVDASSSWPAGDNSTKQTMERTKLGGWQTSAEPGGTPGSENSKPIEVKPQLQLQPGMLAIASPTTTENSDEEKPHEVRTHKDAGVWWIAGLMAFFSGGVILILKKKIKMV